MQFLKRSHKLIKAQNQRCRNMSKRNIRLEQNIKAIKKMAKEMVKASFTTRKEATMMVSGRTIGWMGKGFFTILMEILPTMDSGKMMSFMEKGSSITTSQFQFQGRLIIQISVHLKTSGFAMRVN